MGARPRVVVIGAGVAALEFLLALAELAPGRADVELVAPEVEFSYRPFAVAETFGAGPAYRLELERIVSHAGAARRRGRAVAIDADQRQVTTAAGETIGYDLLVVACGARSLEALPGALTFRGEEDEGLFRAFLEDLRSGVVRSAVFAAMPGAAWTLPLYELALMTAGDLARTGSQARLALVTPEETPLELFGAAAAHGVAELLAAAGIEVLCSTYAERIVGGEVRLVPEGSIAAERVVTMPRLEGPQLPGLPADANGFLPTDVNGRVQGADDVYAAGDATTFPVKQGGIAVQQAEAAAEAVAARLGGPVRAQPFRPCLRGLLLTGEIPLFLSSELTGGLGETSAVAVHPLWWPPTKIAGGRLSRLLRSEGLPVPPPPAGPATVPVTVALPPEGYEVPLRAVPH